MLCSACICVCDSAELHLRLWHIFTPLPIYTTLTNTNGLGTALAKHPHKLSSQLQRLYRTPTPAFFEPTGTSDWSWCYLYNLLIIYLQGRKDFLFFHSICKTSNKRCFWGVLTQWSMCHVTRGFNSKLGLVTSMSHLSPPVSTPTTPFEPKGEGLSK